VPLFPRSVRHRLNRRRSSGRSYFTPVLSPFEERLRLAALGDHVCRVWPVAL
jgi:hypothetical protein